MRNWSLRKLSRAAALRGPVGAPVLAILALAATACRPVDTASWAEEVRLHDGQMIEVRREETRKSSGFPIARRGPIVSRELRFSPLKATWTGDGRRQPLSFELFDGVPQIVLLANEREWCNGKPDDALPVESFVWTREGWHPIPIERARLGQALANLDPSPWRRTAKEDPRGLVTWKQKAPRLDIFENAPESVMQSLKRSNIDCRLYRR